MHHCEVIFYYKECYCTTVEGDRVVENLDFAYIYIVILSDDHIFPSYVYILDEPTVGLQLE